MTRRRIALLLAVGCAACGGHSERANPTARIDTVSIESDVGLVAEPGLGAAAHVEYHSGGGWRVVFTCDTELSGYVCDYDLIASVDPPGELSLNRANDFETDDYWYRVDEGAVRVLAFTAFDRDEVSLLTEPGVPLRIDLLLDGAEVRRAVAWPSDGSVRTSAPTLPLEFLPESP
jgi:hypothetical protein